MVGFACRNLFLVFTLALVAGCTASQSAHRAGVSYNRAFADARNEVLLLNILRAAAREPMLFSSINQVSGAPRPGMEISIPFENIILGGAEAINPTLGLSARNPSITIVPLEERGFREGMARPVPLTLVDELTGQGWDRPTALQLTVGGVVCREKPTEHVELNLGDNDRTVANFSRVLSASRNFSIPAQTEPVTTLRLSASELADFLRQGPGQGREIGDITPQGSDAATTYQVEVLRPASARATGLDFTSGGEGEQVCPAGTLDPAQGVRVLTRSPQSMIFFLAALHRRALGDEIDRCAGGSAAGPALFRIRVSCGNAPAPPTALVSAWFRGRRYYIEGSEDGGTNENTLRVFTLLTELIALQTTAASLQANRPILTIPQ